MKYIFLSFLSFAILTPLGKSDEYDKKILDVLYRELRAATKLLKRKKTSRNYYRVYNSRVEILKIKSKQIRKLQFAKKDSPQVKKLKGLNFKFYEKTKSIGDELAETYKKFANMGKFFLMQGLLVFEYEESSSDIPVYLIKAVKNLKDSTLKNHAAGKLGDYYFNQKNFENAIKFYKYALRLQKKSAWSDRYYYNMAWSFFKLDMFKSAVSSLVAIYQKSPKKDQSNYYYTQAVKKIPEFYVFAGEPDRGFRFIRKTQINDGKALFEYIKYVYSKGFFDKFDEYISDIEENLQRKNRKNTLLRFRVEMYNFLVNSEFKKSRVTMLRLRKSILSYYEKGSLPNDAKKEFLEANMKLLTENFNRINRKDFSKRDKYFKPIIRDTLNLLETMIITDQSKKKSYELRYAQVLRRSGQNEDALKYFEKLFNSQKNKSSASSIKILEEIIAIYSLKESDPSETSKEIRYYQQYLRYGKDKEVKRLIYLKLYDMFYAQKEYKKAYSLTKSFYKKYPKEHKQVELMLLKLASAIQEERNEDFIKDIRRYVSQNPELKKSKQLNEVTSASYQNLVLSKINKLLGSESSDKGQVASKLVDIYRNKEIDRVNRLISGFNAGLLYSKIGAFKEASGVLGSIVDESLANEFTNYSDKISFIAVEGMSSVPESSLALMTKIYTKACKLKALNRNRVFVQYFESLLFNESYYKLSELSKTLNSCAIEDHSKEKAVALIYEYSDFLDDASVVNSLKFLNKRSINSSIEFNSYFQDYLAYKVNSFNSLKKESYRGLLASIEKIAAQASVSNQEVFVDFKNVLTTGVNSMAFEAMAINERSVEGFLDKNLSLFAEASSMLGQYQTKYAIVANLKDVVLVTLFDDLFSFMDDYPSHVENKEKLDSIKGLIEQALTPFRAKYKELVSSLMLKKAEVPLRLLSLEKPMNFYSWDKRYYTVDKQ